ncbi:hypothetical protein [Labilibaculum manganireducens]|nr:hypothetical protein [Labilibaculum manganireducens]
MKIFKILSLIVALGFFFSACEDTNENLVATRGIAVVPTITSLTPESPLFTDLTEASFITFTASLAEGDMADAAEIQVVYEGKVGVVKAIESFPIDTKITAPEILSSLEITEADVKLGTSFFLYVITTSEGISSRSQAAVEIKMPCEFDSELSFGSYAAVSGDWGVDSNVKILTDENDPYTLYVSGLAEADACTGNGNTVTVYIDPVTFQLTGDTERTIVAADCGGWGAGYEDYTNYSYTVSSGFFNSCDGTYNIAFKLEYLPVGGTEYTSWGDNGFTFTRN